MAKQNIMDRSNLHNYQEHGVDFIINHSGAALFLDMGLGKSVTTLTAISDLIDNIEITHVLVVAPKKVAESTWSDEVEKWDHLKHLRVSVILGDAKKRKEAMLSDADIYVTSRDLLVWVLTNAKELNFKFDMVVLDELTSFKNSAAQRFKALRKVRPFVNRCVGLTGTPAPNGLKDLWAQMYCIDLGKSLGHSKTKFINAFFDTYKMQNVVIKCTPKRDAEKDIYKLIEPVTLTMKAEDYLELPPLIERTIKVCLSDAVRKKYDTFERDNVLQYIEETKETPENLIASSAAALCNKLCQFANGAVYNEEHLAIEMHEEKVDMLLELIEQAAGESVLVFYQFQHDYHRVMARLQKEYKELRIRKYEDDKDLKAWNNKEVDVLFTHAASTAYGLNLQRGGHIVIWFGTGWNAELYLQGNARLHRQGQEQPTVVYRLIVADTMDEKALNAIDGKVSSQDAMLDALKEKIINLTNKKE